MLKIKELKAAAQAAVERQNALIALAETEKREFTADEQKEFDALTVSITKHLADVKRLQDVEIRSVAVAGIVETVLAARDVTGVVDRIAQPVQRTAVPALSASQLEDPDFKKFGIVGVCAWASAKAKAYPTMTAIQHMEAAGLQKIADMAKEQQQLAMAEKSWTTGSGGDNVVFTPLSTDFIAYLYNASAFLAGQPMIIDMPYGSMKIPGGNASAAGAYATEVADAGYSEGTTRQVSLTAKHLKVITAISNYLIEVSPLAVASIVGQDLANSMTVSLDAAGLRGSGSGANPSGIKVLTSAGQIVHSVPGSDPKNPTIAEVEADAKLALGVLRAQNIPWIRPRWTMSNRVFTYLQFLRNSLGLPVYPDLATASPTWLGGIPVTRSEQVPNNLSDGTHSDCSEIYLTLFGHIVMAITRQLRLQASQEAAYVNSGTLSAFSRDETVIRGIASHDFNMRYVKANYLIDQVRWGA